MAKGRKTGGGSRKGIPNRATTSVRENTLAVFDLIGGQPEMAQWAKENRTEFYRLYGRLAPQDSNAPGSAENPYHVNQSLAVYGIASKG